MNRRHFLLAGAAFAAPGRAAAPERLQRGLLWRVEKKGVLALLEADGHRAARVF